MLRELPFEVGDGLTVREVAPVDRLTDARKNSFPDDAIRRLQVDEWDSSAFQQAWLRGGRVLDARVIAVRGLGTRRH
jgi:hypothetical protein